MREFLEDGEFIQDADFCFIDGGHSYECIKADTENSLRILSSNGAIVWDDYTVCRGSEPLSAGTRRDTAIEADSGSQFVIYRRQA